MAMAPSHRIAEMDRIVWSKRTYMLDELLSSHRFPLIVQVVRGHYGSEDTDSFGMGQILRIHRKQRRKRVIAVEDGRGRRLSIPRDFNIPFERLPVKRETRGQLLDEILCDNQLPIKVQFSRQAKLNYHVDSDATVDENFGTMTIEYIYDEMTLQGNAINFGFLDYGIIDIPAYLRLQFSEAEGILGEKDQSTFKSLCERLDAIVESEINYEDAPGTQNIPLYYPRKNNASLDIENTMPDKTLSIEVCDSNNVQDNTTAGKALNIPNLETIIDGSWKENADNDEYYSPEYIPKHFSSPRPLYMQDNFVLMSDSKIHNNVENKPENTYSSSRSNLTLPHRSRSSSISSTSSTTFLPKATDKKFSYKKASKRTGVPHRFKYDKKEALQVDDEHYTFDPELYHKKQSIAADNDIFPGLFKSSSLMKMNKEAFKVDTSNSQTSNEGVFIPTTEYELNEKGKKVKMKKNKEKTKMKFQIKKGKIKKEKRISKIEDLPQSLEEMNVNQVIDMLTLLKLGSYSPTVAIEGIDGRKLKAMRTTEFETKIGMNAQDANKLAAFCLEKF